MITLKDLLYYTDGLLEVREFNDYCPNGLQIEACQNVNKIITGVTASLALIEAAIEQKANTLLVHHGYFWKGEQAQITGIKGRRIAALLQNKINLIAYHLPLDAHNTLGNNVQLAHILGFDIECGLDDKKRPIGLIGRPQQSQNLAQLAQNIEKQLQRQPLVIGDAKMPIKRLAWCTGAAQSYIEKAIDAGVDCFITGEVSEQTVHLANEAGIGFISAGHHATERYGIKALGEHLAGRFAVEVEFIDMDNPV